MTINTRLPAPLLPHFSEQIQRYREYMKNKDLRNAWKHLERAHIIGQSYPFAHTYVHWQMLKFGFRIKSTKEIIGQIPRLLFGGVKSFVGTVPIGNPGGADVPPLKTFPIAPDLQSILDKAK